LGGGEETRRAQQGSDKQVRRRERKREGGGGRPRGGFRERGGERPGEVTNTAADWTVTRGGSSFPPLLLKQFSFSSSFFSFGFSVLKWTYYS